MRLDISVGPVQGFVAQSRRTRDLWSSSYLLSFLVAHAMHGAQSAGGRVVQPTVDDDPLYRWASGWREGEVPQLGSLPNHFVVEAEGTPSDVARAAQEEPARRVVWGMPRSLGRIRQAHRRERQRHGSYLATPGERALGIRLDRGRIRRT